MTSKELPVLTSFTVRFTMKQVVIITEELVVLAANISIFNFFEGRHYKGDDVQRTTSSHIFYCERFTMEQVVIIAEELVVLAANISIFNFFEGRDSKGNDVQRTTSSHIFYCERFTMEQVVIIAEELVVLTANFLVFKFLEGHHCKQRSICYYLLRFFLVRKTEYGCTIFCSSRLNICFTFQQPKSIHSQIMETPDSAPNPELLLQLVSMKMPYGKYKGTLLCDLPVYYLE